MAFTLIAKSDDETWVFKHKDRTVCEASFDAVKSLMTDGYGFSLEDIHEALSVMEAHDYNYASFGFNKRFVFAKEINDQRSGVVYHA